MGEQTMRMQARLAEAMPAKKKLPSEIWFLNFKSEYII